MPQDGEIAGPAAKPQVRGAMNATNIRPARWLDTPVLLALAFGIMVAISGATIWLAGQARIESRLVAEALEDEAEIVQFFLQLRRAESAERGYLLTGNSEFLEDFRALSVAVMPDLARLRSAAAGNPAQQARLDRLERMVRARLARFSDAIRLLDEGDRQGAAELVRSGRAGQLLESVRTAASEMVAEQRRLLSQHRVSVARTEELLLAATAGGTVLLLLLAALTIVSVRRSNRERDRAQRALAASHADLERVVAARTAALTEANQEIQRFAYLVSHDLRAPLVNIMGFTAEIERLRTDIAADLAARESTAEGAAKAAGYDRDFAEALGFIKTSAANMDRLIGAVLELSRHGHRPFRPELVDMTALLRGVAAGVAHQAHGAGTAISVGDLPEVVGDRLALERVFANLIDNAVKYLQPDRPGLVSVTGQAAPGQVTYQVTDNGRGIDPADQHRIFELFRRAGPQDRPGEGVGLAHARALVRRLGGTLSLSSEPGRGSTFTVTLPRVGPAGVESDAA